MYGILALCGMLAAGFTVCRTAKKAGHDDNDFIVLLLIIALGVLCGGHLFYGLIHLPLIIATVRTIFGGEGDTGNHLVTTFRILLPVFGGNVFYGGLLGGIAAGTIYGTGKFGRALPGAADIIAPAIPLFHFFGRIGCFMAGCCYGIENDFGFIYTESIIPGANGVRRLPVQLMESFFNLGLFLLLAALYRISIRPSGSKLFFRGLRGHLIWFYLFLYPAGRFALEFFRGDEYRGIWGPFSTSQWISLVLFTAAILALGRGFLVRQKPCLVTIIGPKHSGKTSVGLELSKLLGIPFFDLDTLIEERKGKTPRELYREGPEQFQAAEAEALEELLNDETRRQAVLAAGGGITDNKKVLALLKAKKKNAKNVYTVYIDVPADTAWDRINAAGDLPPFLLVPGRDPKLVHKELHRKRAADCRKLADYTVCGAEKSPALLAEEIAHTITA